MSQYNIDNKVVKKPSDDRELTPDEADEWVKCAMDVEYWLENYAYVQGASGKTLFTPRAYQKRIIKKASRGRFFIGLVGRQAGKSTTIGLLKLHKAIFFGDTRIGLTSYKLANVKDFIERMKFCYEHLPEWMKPPVIEYNRFTIRFSNGSSIVGQVTGPSTFRGLSLTDIILDELAFVKPDVAEEFWTSLLPSMSADGDAATTTVVIVSTPNGTGGLFASLWFSAVNGVNGFLYEKVEYEEIPGRGTKFEADMLKKMSRNKFDQEFRCAFISDKGTLINSRMLEGIKTKDPVEVIGDLRLFVSDFKGRKLAMACDCGEGVGQDFHAIQIIDIEKMEQVAEYQNNILPQTHFTKEIVRIVQMLYKRGAEDVFYTIENNGVGNGVMRLIESVQDPVFSQATMISEPGAKKLGMATTGKNKIKGCMQFKDMVELNVLTLHSERLITQLKFFVKSGASYAAESGANDDLCMAMVVLMNMLVVLGDYEEAVSDVVNELSMEGSDDECWGIGF